MTLNDIVTLGNMGFSRDDIFKLMQAQTAPAPVPVPAPAPVPAPVVQPAPVVTPAQPVPAQPDYAAQLADISKQIAALQTPQAGNIGNQPEPMSIDDIIAAPFKIPTPKQAQA